ncbi:MAG: DUF5054 domain-containing protein [Fusobacteriaceae bacterium]
MMIKKVHVIYKTHLDIGFTNLAGAVKKRYIEEFIPKTIQLAKEVNSDGKKRFVWTTGSWLIYTYLKEVSNEKKEEFKTAIKNGDIIWHGLPFTTHTELMNKETFNYGLSYSEKLDKEFNNKTIASKMTDVPGHTQAMIPLMKKAGLEYLHLGVNPSSAIPDVPGLFVWKFGEDSIIVNYAKEYGEEVSIEGHDEILVFAHSGDNCGPPSAEEINATIEKFEKKFPGAEVIGSTLDAFAKNILKFKDKLPVIEKEFGDTWIHGLGTDPYKVSFFKTFMRQIDEWLASGKLKRDSKEYIDIMDYLIMIPEHTWGMDIKLHFQDFLNFSKEDFKKALEKDLIDKSSIPEKYNFIGLFSDTNEAHLKQKFERRYSTFEKSWAEQREFIKSAYNILSAEMKKELDSKMASILNCEACKETEEKKIKLGNYEIKIENSGALSSIKKESKELLVGNFGEYIFRFTSENEYEENFKNYSRDLSENRSWCIPDFGKPGMEFIKNRIISPIIYSPKLQKVLLNEASKILILELKFEKEIFEDYDLPKNIKISYDFSSNEKVLMELEVKGQSKIRLPIEQWISFMPKTVDENWKMQKISSEINPFNIVNRGNKNLHGVEAIKNNQFEFIPLDSQLVSFQSDRILNFNKDTYPKNKFSINIYNNMWGTNFPMWYSDDIRTRFIIKF